MVALVGTMEARALELGWRVVGERQVRVGARSLPERRWLLECVVCGGRVSRGLRWADSGSRYMTCEHPAVDEQTPWEEDAPCRLLVERFGAMTLEEVGQALGVTRERVRQIESKALRRLRRRLEADGMDADEAREFLAELAAGTDRVASATEHMSEKGGGGPGQHDRRVAMTKWIDPDELAERVRERAEVAAQVDAALALARAPMEDDEPAPPARGETAMAQKTCKQCGGDFDGHGPAKYCSESCKAAAKAERDGTAAPKRSRSQSRRIAASVEPISVVTTTAAASARQLLEVAGFSVRAVHTPAGVALFVDEGGAA